MPVYLYWGEEEFNINLEVNDSRSKLLDPAWAMLNHKILNEPDINTLIESLQVTPMFTGNMLIEVKSSSIFMRGTKKAGNSNVLNKKLLDLLENLNDKLYVIFICEVPRDSGKKIDSSLKIVKIIQKCGIIKDFPAFKQYQEKDLLLWIKQRASKKKVKITDKAALLLLKNTGTDLRRLDSEIEKLKLSVHPSDLIDIKNVAELSATHENIFLLADLIIKNEKIKAANELHKLYEKDHPIKIISTLQTVVRKWLKIKTEIRTKNIFDVAKMLNVHKFIVEKDLDRLKDVNIEDLIELKLKLTDCENKIKTGDIIPELALELVIIS